MARITIEFEDNDIRAIVDGEAIRIDDAARVLLNKLVISTRRVDDCPPDLVLTA
jgi:hypothetical protein